MTFDVVFSESDQTFRTEFEELNIVSGDVIKAQDKTVSPAETAQVVQPDTGYNYLSQVTVEAIPASLYADSEALQSIIGRSITSFSNDQTTSIGAYTFNSCGQLTEISLSNVTSMGEYAFANCSSLEKVYFPKLSSVSNYGFYQSFNSSAIIKPTVNVSFPNVETIGRWSFATCGCLAKIDFNTLSSIDTYAFVNDSRLEALIIRTPEVCTLKSTNAFNSSGIVDTNKIRGYIYVPQSLVERYKAATNWTTFHDKIRAIEDYPEITGG